MASTLIYNARLAGEQAAGAWVLVEGQTIAAAGHGALPPQASDALMVDARGALLMPGVIDCHVHFREPGMTLKADMAGESRAALAGGVTSIIDMPNTKPPTTTVEAWQHKMDLAREKCLTNYAFFIGATSDNAEEMRRADPARVPGVKLFMGSSTGNMLVDDDKALERIFMQSFGILAVHAEDQAIIDANSAAARARHPEGEVPVSEHTAIRSDKACYSASRKAAMMADALGRRLHICHLTTALELGLLSRQPLGSKRITSEVSPHHLMWCDEDYAAKGARIKMNPSVKTARDRDRLRQALADGLIDMVATDHAPHLLSDKQGDAFTAASGAPLVQFSLPIVLTIMGEEVALRAMCANPAKVYGIVRRGEIKPGYYADLALVRKVEPYAISDADVVSKCGWTPAAGFEASYRVEKTWVNGSLAYDQGRFSPEPASMPLEFITHPS